MKPRRLREQACGHVPRKPGVVVRTEHGPLAAPAVTARLPPLHSQPACRQDRVVASGADTVLGRQAGERHGSIKERLRQMEAQLEENKVTLETMDM